MPLKSVALHRSFSASYHDVCSRSGKESYKFWCTVQRPGSLCLAVFASVSLASLERKYGRTGLSVGNSKNFYRFIKLGACHNPLTLRPVIMFPDRALCQLAYASIVSLLSWSRCWSLRMLSRCNSPLSRYWSAFPLLSLFLVVNQCPTSVPSFLERLTSCGPFLSIHNACDAGCL
jgi:hypothetical protein